MIDNMLNTFPGISVAFIDKTGDTKLECYGFSNKDQNLLVNENTIFPACSISKFVAVITLFKLQECKCININSPINKYLRKWKLLSSNGEESSVTIKEIMSHTSGIVDGDNSFYGYRLYDDKITLIDILEGKTHYNNRVVRVSENIRGEFEYSDAGYCVLQLLIEETMNKTFEEVVHEMVISPLKLNNTFYATSSNLKDVKKVSDLSIGYDEENNPIIGKFISCPDLASAGLLISPKELLKIAKEFMLSLKGESAFLSKGSSIEIIQPLIKFPWAGLGIFIQDNNVLMSQGWSEHGQCMMKIDLNTDRISIVMTNRNPGCNQEQSGIESLVNRNLL